MIILKFFVCIVYLGVRHREVTSGYLPIRERAWGCGAFAPQTDGVDEDGPVKGGQRALRGRGVGRLGGDNGGRQTRTSPASDSKTGYHHRFSMLTSRVLPTRLNSLNSFHPEPSSCSSPLASTDISRSWTLILSFTDSPRLFTRPIRSSPHISDDKRLGRLQLASLVDNHICLRLLDRTFLLDLLRQNVFTSARHTPHMIQSIPLGSALLLELLQRLGMLEESPGNSSLCELTLPRPPCRHRLGRLDGLPSMTPTLALATPPSALIY